MMYRQAILGDCTNPDLVKENATSELKRMAALADEATGTFNWYVRYTEGMGSVYEKGMIGPYPTRELANRAIADMTARFPHWSPDGEPEQLA